MQRWLDIISLVLVIIGAINWGLVGLFEFDLVAEISGNSFGDEPNTFAQIIYIIVGIAGIYQLYPLYRLAMGEEAVSSRA